MSTLKARIFSEDGMKAVNLLFFLSLFLRRSGLIFAAYTVWIVYLAYGLRTTSSRAMRVVNTLCLLFAVFMLAANAWLLVQALH